MLPPVFSMRLCAAPKSEDTNRPRDTLWASRYQRHVNRTRLAPRCWWLGQCDPFWRARTSFLLEMFTPSRNRRIRFLRLSRSIADDRIVLKNCCSMPSRSSQHDQDVCLFDRPNKVKLLNRITRPYSTCYGLILIVPVLLVRECAVSFTAHVPGAMLLGSRKITWVKIEPGVVRTSSAVRL